MCRLTAVGEFDRQRIRRLRVKRVPLKIRGNRPIRLKRHSMSAGNEMLNKLDENRFIRINQRFTSCEDNIDVGRETIAVHNPNKTLKLFNLHPQISEPFAINSIDRIASEYLFPLGCFFDTSEPLTFEVAPSKSEKEGGDSCVFSLTLDGIKMFD